MLHGGDFGACGHQRRWRHDEVGVGGAAEVIAELGQPLASPGVQHFDPEGRNHLQCVNEPLHEKVGRRKELPARKSPSAGESWFELYGRAREIFTKEPDNFRDSRHASLGDDTVNRYRNPSRAEQRDCSGYGRKGFRIVCGWPLGILDLRHAVERNLNLLHPFCNPINLLAGEHAVCRETHSGFQAVLPYLLTEIVERGLKH